MIYLCEDCAKTTTREWTPGFKRLNEYKTYSTERGDLDEQEEFKSNKAPQRESVKISLEIYFNEYKKPISTP
jgi:hypothetical protein